MPYTIYDISQKAGVSIATVSRVLNGSSNVKPATREKVMQVIKEFDYTPNAFARGMGLGSLRTVGILCADSSDSFLAKAVYYLERELHAHGYESLLCCTGYDLEDRRNYVNLILSKKVDSLILVGSNFVSVTDTDNTYIRDAATQVPVMLLNASYNCPNVYSTLCNDQESMYEATSCMLRSGIRDILYLYDSNSYSSVKKMAGYREAMSENQIPDFEHLIRYYGGKSDDFRAIADCIERAAEEGLTFHGVIGSDDSLAVGAMKYATRKGLCVPKDLAVIGYNNSVLACCTSQEITSVDNRLETLTHQLVQTLLGVLSGLEMPAQSLFSGQLIKRDTTP